MMQAPSGTPPLGLPPSGPPRVYHFVEWPRYRAFVAVTAALHGVTAVVVMAVGFGQHKDWPVPVCGSYSTWAPLDPSVPCFEKLADGRANICAVRTAYKRIGTVRTACKRTRSARPSKRALTRRRCRPCCCCRFSPC